MILEEIFGSFVSLFSSIIAQTPPISRESQQQDYSLIFTANPEREDGNDDLIHREYDQERPPELPYYEENVSYSVLLPADAGTRQDFCESFLRSCTANLGFVTAAMFILGLLTVGLVYVDLNTTNACIEWMHNNFTVPSNIRIVRMVGMSVTLLPLYAWFPTCILMFWGFGHFKKHYLLCLFACQSVTLFSTIVYKVVAFDVATSASVEYRYVNRHEDFY